MPFEFEILNYLQHLRTPFGDVFMPFVSSLGNAGIIWILLAIVLLLIPKTRKAGWLVFIALLFDVVYCNLILKNVFHRTRPYDINTAVQLLIAKPIDFSFPSGHTAASFAAVTALFFTKNKKMWIPALVLACLIAFSRMYLYVHFPTDILGGVAIGVLSGLCSFAVVRRYEMRQKKEK